MTEVKARITSLKQEIEVLKTRVENAKKDKEKYMLDLIAEEQQTQESIVSLLDAISRYKETVDVVIMKEVENQCEVQRLHSFAESCSSELYQCLFIQ